MRHLFWFCLSPLGSTPPPDISDFLSFSVAHDQLQAPPCKIGTMQDQRPSQISRMQNQLLRNRGNPFHLFFSFL